MKRDGSNLPRINRELEREWIKYSSEVEKATPGGWRNHLIQLGAGQKIKSSQERNWEFNINGVKLHKHEKDTVDFLLSLGKHVELREVSKVEGQKSADCYVDGERVEMKAPEGDSRNTVYQNVREGSRQSSVVLVDLQRTSISLEESIAQAQRAMSRYDRVHKIMILSQTGEIEVITRGVS